MKKKWLIGVGMVVLVGAMVTVAALQGQGSAPEVEVTQLVKDELSEEVMVSGTLMPRDQEQIFYQPERGELDVIKVEEGDKVKKGDTILDYKNPYSRVKASQSGTVIKVEEVPPSQAATRPAVVIADLEKQEVHAEVSEFEALKVEKGQSVTLESDALPGETWKGEVVRVAYLPAESDTGGGNDQVVYPVTVQPEEALPVKMGSKLMVVIQTQPTEALTLPQSAVVTRGEKSLVFVVEDGKAREREVKLGISDGERVEVRSGVEQDDDVIVEPPQGLKNGEEVTVR
ncbi:efflux RND transporter periplasmic adaptor subunit [Desmospora profundinema]|uniref:Multidrug efflux pump subunit AcrA (Membrane-fusion protein) n=1 Tax=Desmospora profundinema TaxID=1571184 RepID=A0ABU1ITC5_9BACL|nr:efflux RND transporter periplasmic adaptor subunit [Desmospora profundinema]MDR6227020.1 multidrug efflux pump subunit AcrA (membrane-fusion protein) [Desmospora profundinema]